MDRLKIALVGAGRRGGGSYLPIIAKMDDYLELVAVCDGHLSVASEIMSIANAYRNDTEPEYGALNGRIDQEVALAMAKSWNSGNVPVELPLPVEPR